ncbi:MAG: uncharacterized protein JWP89_2345 [Schlesneria sp.]|nr:uncharacterized protein [Schlesneria sp.]
MDQDDYLPRKGDSLFKLNPTGDMNADLAFLKGDKYGFVVAKAFKASGDAIIQRFQDTHEWYKDPELFMPAMYCYRHYIEMILKWNLQCGGAWKLTSVTEAELTKEHSLHRLWNGAKPVIQTLWSSLNPETLDSVQRLILDMHTIDETGQNMRYAADKHDNHTLAKVPDVVSLDHLQEMALKLYRFFEKLEDEWQRWMGQQEWEDGHVEMLIDERLGK